MRVKPYLAHTGLTNSEYNVFTAFCCSSGLTSCISHSPFCILFIFELFYHSFLFCQEGHQLPGFYTCHFSRYFCSLLASLFFRYGHGLYFPCQRPLPESAQLLAHCSFARQSQCICALHLSCRYCERPLYTILSIIFTFCLTY